MTTREIILTAQNLSEITSSSPRTRKVSIPVSLLRAAVKVKRVATYISSHALTLIALAGCIALTLCWGYMGLLLLSVPYAMIFDHLDIKL